MLALSGGEIALIILAVFWGVLVLFIGLVMVNVFRLVESTKLMVDGLREQTVPLLGDVRVTVQSVNRELDRVDTMLVSGGKMAKSAERITGVAEQVVTNPLIRVAASAAAAAAFFKRMQGRK